ncbi:hypothetical protein A2707_00395 [Candidatus Saccharibacteria bacterium RIFCSPHIGHO2_01_FULL_45_15]|nr:MAG: hypothetical protein A2707_00395 [Candidatus Saccharibacteria bacterium RIFCSPHIGHO2_01_FULL_45_15]OGL26837.1 MAG: hypothetical protein A3C39_01510 [Candidatus Saccharibacteria bacterium RIFCSPHIGHO2_02_FULL_46_12]OGL32143.1 MAG: hypothetical protein A3E76_04050 [Candidatus Saccharibacteria bacterium RIFCSPHIGHO2_12_FULL_44_22]
MNKAYQIEGGIWTKDPEIPYDSRSRNEILESADEFVTKTVMWRAKVDREQAKRVLTSLGLYRGEDNE